MIPVTGFEDRKDNLWMMLLRTLAHLFKVPSHIMDERRQERRAVAHAGWLLSAHPWEQVDWEVSGKPGRE